MDPSALIFVALAIAWAVYLIPKALEHHDAGDRVRTVDRFSSALRVLARRDAVSRKETRLVRNAERRARAHLTAESAVAPPATTADAATDIATDIATDGESGTVVPRVSEPVPTRHLDDSGLLPAHTFVRRSAAARAARRRRRVAGVLVLAHALVASLAVAQVCSWLYLLAPVGLLAVWLYACRRMVVRERSERRSPRQGATRVPVRVAPRPAAGHEGAHVSTDETTDLPVVDADLVGSDVGASTGWTPVSTPLPTYVSKPVAPRRSVRTIDLDATGVWSSGRNAADSALAQQADAERAERQASREEQRRSS